MIGVLVTGFSDLLIENWRYNDEGLITRNHVNRGEVINGVPT